MQDFAAGQRWTYRTRVGEETSTLLVLGRDQSAGGMVGVSVRLEGVTLHPSGQIVHELAHAPFEESALRESVLDLLQTGVPLPDLTGYEQWRPAFERGETGAFSVSVAQMLDMVDQATQQPTHENPLFRKSNG